MYNAVKMELYRMVRMKSFYVMIIVMAAMTFITTWALDFERSYYQDTAQESEQNMDMELQEAEESLESTEDEEGIVIGVQGDSNRQDETESEEGIVIGMQASMPDDDLSDVTLLDMAFSDLQGMIFAFYLAIFVVLFCGADLTSGYIKNFVGQAKSRTRLVAAKAVAMSVYTIGMLLLFLGVQAVASGIFFGYIHIGDAGSFFSYLAVQAVLHIAFVMICLAIVLVSRSTVISMIFSICICWNVLSLLYMGIDMIANKIGVKDFSFSTYTISGRIRMLSDTFSRQDSIETLAVAAVYLILTFVVGSVAFTKKDI